MTLQRNPLSNKLLIHNADTAPNPGAVGKLMDACCCHVCQWAIDWVYVCIGGCYGDPAIWMDSSTPTTIPGDVHNPPAWAPSTAYATPAQIVYSGSGVNKKLRALKIKHTSPVAEPVEADAYWDDYWVSASTWIAYQNGAAGTVTPATYPDANAYQLITDVGIAGPPPAPGVHCAGHPGNVGQANNLAGCSATRYGPIHGSSCPVIVDVSMTQPAVCQHSVMCGACVQCGPAATGANCYEHDFTPGVLPCSLSVSYDFTVTSTSFNLAGTKIINITDCSYTTSGINASERKYSFRGDDADIPTCPGGAVYLQSMDVFYFYDGGSGAQYWSFVIGWYYCDGSTQKTFSVSGSYNVNLRCNPIITLTDPANFSPSEPATGMSLVITSNNP